ncbi:TspO/MBR family protein [Nocardia sp. BMG111209]|uniref:TspO/MBR family protein n=1 Tax=Nocardia sp. BMG111209 TaxID=1160137 RepID=UPI0003A7EAED
MLVALVTDRLRRRAGDRPAVADRLLPAGLVAAAALAGAAASGSSSQWYRRLDKPGYQPPRQVFPLAWTSLYADIIVTTTAALHRGSAGQRRGLRAALAVNMLLNGSWTWVFFRAHRLGAATAVAAALTVSSADLTRRTAAGSRRGWWLAAYPVWCAFATVLSADIWNRNRSEAVVVQPVPPRARPAPVPSVTGSAAFRPE